MGLLKDQLVTIILERWKKNDSSEKAVAGRRSMYYGVVRIFPSSTSDAPISSSSGTIVLLESIHSGASVLSPLFDFLSSLETVDLNADSYAFDFPNFFILVGGLMKTFFPPC